MMRYFSKDPRIENFCFKEHLPLLSQVFEKKIQITFKDGLIVHETKQSRAVNICMIKGGLQFCVKGEPYIIEEGDILDLNPYSSFPNLTSHEDAILLTLVKANGDKALEEKLKCNAISA